MSGLKKLTSATISGGHGPRKYGISDLSQISSREDTPPPVGVNATDNAKYQHRVRGAQKEHHHVRSATGFSYVITPLERQKTLRMNRDHAMITRGYLGNSFYRHPKLRKKYGSSDDLLDEMRYSDPRKESTPPPSYHQRLPALSRESPPPVCTCNIDPPAELSTSTHNSSFEESLKRREAQLKRSQSRSLHQLASGNHSDPNLLLTDNSSLEDSGYHDFEDLIAAHSSNQHHMDTAYRNKLNECWNRIQRHRQQQQQGSGLRGAAPTVGVTRKESSSSTGSSVSSSQSSSSVSAKSSPPLAQSSARTSVSSLLFSPVL